MILMCPNIHLRLKPLCNWTWWIQPSSERCRAHIQISKLAMGSGPEKYCKTIQIGSNRFVQYYSHCGETQVGGRSSFLAMQYEALNPCRHQFTVIQKPKVQEWLSQRIFMGREILCLRGKKWKIQTHSVSNRSREEKCKWKEFCFLMTRWPAVNCDWEDLSNSKLNCIRVRTRMR